MVTLFTHTHTCPHSHPPIKQPEADRVHSFITWEKVQIPLAKFKSTSKNTTVWCLLE